MSLLVHSPNALQQGLDQAKARSPEPNLGILSGLQEPKYLNCDLLPPRVLSSRKLEWRTELALQHRHCTGDVEISKIHSSPALHSVSMTQ